METLLCVIFFVPLGALAFWYGLSRSRASGLFESANFRPDYKRIGFSVCIAIERDTGRLALINKGHARVFEPEDVLSWKRWGKKMQVSVRDLDKPVFHIVFPNDREAATWVHRLSALYR